MLTIWTGTTPHRRIRGIVTHFGIQEYNGWQIRHQLIISPPLWRAGLRQNFRLFQQQDIQTIIRKAVPQELRTRTTLADEYI